jgi:hypothetical protein
MFSTFTATLDRADLDGCIGVLYLLCSIYLHTMKTCPEKRSVSVESLQRPLVPILQRAGDLLTDAKPHVLLELARLVSMPDCFPIYNNQESLPHESSAKVLTRKETPSKTPSKPSLSAASIQQVSIPLIHRQLLARLLMFCRRSLGEFSFEQLQEILHIFHPVSSAKDFNGDVPVSVHVASSVGVVLPPDVVADLQKQLEMMNPQRMEEPELLLSVDDLMM